MKTKKLIIMVAVGSLLFFSSSCLDLFKTKEYQYTVELTPAGDGFERKLTCSKNASSEQRSHIGELYRKQQGKHIFVGIFTNVPNDINESGSFMHLNTQMGTSSLYTERFRGSDDVYARLEKGYRSIDILVDLLIGWFEMELGHEPNFEMLRTFCSQNLRQDIKNIYVYIYVGTIVSQMQTDGHIDMEESSEGEPTEHVEQSSQTETTEYVEEFAARAYHYFAARGYFDQIQLPDMAGAMNYAENRDDCGWLMTIIQRFIAGKMGYQDSTELPASLSFLSDAETAKVSFEKYIRASEVYKNAWEKKKLEEDDPNAEPPEAWEAIYTETGIFDWFPFRLFADKYTYKVSLSCGAKPVGSNGKWDEQTKTLTWSATTPEGSSGWQTFFYAAWSMPNKQFQTEHFGKLVLKGENLAEYCLWREGLTQKDAEEWDKFLLSLGPGTELPAQLASFRFTADPAGTTGLANVPRELILSGLGENPP